MRGRSPRGDKTSTPSIEASADLRAVQRSNQRCVPEFTTPIAAFLPRWKPSGRIVLGVSDAGATRDLSSDRGTPNSITVRAAVLKIAGDAHANKARLQYPNCADLVQPPARRRLSDGVRSNAILMYP